MESARKRTGLATAWIVAGIVLASVAAGCSSGGSSKDRVAPSVSATPGSIVFPGDTVTVALAAQDNRSAPTTIYYTTDATIPTTSSPVYQTPLVFSDTTVLKYFAVDRAGNASEIQTAGYTQARFSIEQEWAASGHGDILAEAFRHWDEDGSVSTSCAKCHATDGFVDFIADGSVDAEAALPIGHDCDACHEFPPLTYYDDLDSFPALEPVEFPSGAELTFGNASNLCMACHQGRSSTDQVDAAVEANPDGPYTFINIHYYAAAASAFGAEARGAYEFDGLEYVGRNVFGSHPTSLSDCVGCHMRGAAKDHTFQVRVEDCNSCHAGSSFETLAGSPSNNFRVIQTLQDDLLESIRDYARNVIGEPIAYDPIDYPYFFKDPNDDGVVGEEEGGFGNRYDQFDAKLLRAAYNYQVVAKDPAGYIHNGTYLRQVLVDSIRHLGFSPVVSAPGRPGFDRDAASPSDQWHVSGHADAMAGAFRHWDEDGEISASCAKCHSTPGFRDFVADGSVDAAAPLGSLVECIACHQDFDLFGDPSTRYANLGMNPALEPVEFPSGATASLGNSSNICMACHQGRESGVSVDTNEPNTVVQAPVDYDSFDFVNRHYFAASAILFGTEVTAAYEYAGAPSYRGLNAYAGEHGTLTDCVACHMRGTSDHGFLPEIGDCDACHQGIQTFQDLGQPFGRPNVDYDGDGVGESFQGEIDGMKARTLAWIQIYARNGLPQPSPVVYGPTSYPYWFRDLDDDGIADPEETNFPNRYRDFDRRMLRAAFNYHAAQDPCGDMHNYRYVLQTLFDSLDDLDDGMLNGSPRGMRPE